MAHAGGSAVTASHPPLFPAVLAIGSTLGLRSYHAHLLIGCGLGACTVVAIGAIARRLAGAPLGIAAAVVAAVYLPLVINDSMLMSESLYGLAIALVVLAALGFRELPGPRRGALVGLAIGAAALTRSEALLLFVLLMPFLLRPAAGVRARSAIAMVLAALVVVLPWCVRNTIVFHRVTTITTGDGGVLAGANLHSTYYGQLLGAWDLGGLAGSLPASPTDRYNEAASAALLRRRGLRYAEAHAGRLPVVMGARVLRTWGLYPFSPRGQVNYNEFSANHVPRYEWIALAMHWLAMLLAIPGVLWLRARRLPLAPLLAPLALITVVSMLFFGDYRFRQAANPSLVVLATLGVAGIAARRGRARAGPAQLAGAGAVPDR